MWRSRSSARSQLAAVRGHAIEAGLGDGEERAFGGRRKAELDERRWLFLDVGLRVDPVRDPTEAEVAIAHWDHSVISQGGGRGFGRFGSQLGRTRRGRRG
jgi:hypothetical protein